MSKDYLIFRDAAELRGILHDYFDGDTDKVTLWLATANPSLGNVIPNDMLKAGKLDNLLKFARSAMDEHEAA